MCGSFVNSTCVFSQSDGMNVRLKPNARESGLVEEFPLSLFKGKQDRHQHRLSRGEC